MQAIVSLTVASGVFSNQDSTGSCGEDRLTDTAGTKALLGVTGSLFNTHLWVLELGWLFARIAGLDLGLLVAGCATLSQQSIAALLLLSQSDPKTSSLQALLLSISLPEAIPRLCRSCSLGLTVMTSKKSSVFSQGSARTFLESTNFFAGTLVSRHDSYRDFTAYAASQAVGSSLPQGCDTSRDVVRQLILAMGEPIRAHSQVVVARAICLHFL